jgi:hypothetical protein
VRNMNQKHVLFIAATFLVSSSLINTASAGNVYKWTDDNGTIHYGDKRPKDVQSKTLKVKSTSSFQPTPVQEQLKSLEEKESQENQAKSEKEKELQLKNNNEQRCDQAKTNLQTIENNARIRIEENGELRYMTQEEITAKKDEMRKIVDDACSTK